MKKESSKLKRELELSRKQLHLGSYIVDKLETQILPFCEKVWKWIVEMVSEAIAIVKDSTYKLKEWMKVCWASFIHFLQTNQSCQMFKNKAISLYTDSYTFIATKGAQIKPAGMMK